MNELIIIGCCIIVFYDLGKPFIAYIETHPEDDSDLRQKEL